MTELLSTNISETKNEKANNDDCDDKVLLEQAVIAYNNEQLMKAERLLRCVKNTNLLQLEHTTILEQAMECHTMLDDLLAVDVVEGTAIEEEEKNGTSNGGGWVKQGESHGKFDTCVYYKYPSGLQTVIACRIETPIPTQLLIPLLSVLNETDLFHTWVPYWPRVNIGLHSSMHIRQTSRANQILYLQGPCPWPFSSRQLLLQSRAVDEIDAEQSYIAITLRSMEAPDDIVALLPSESATAVYADFDGTFLFRPCPENHPLLQHQSDLHKVDTSFGHQFYQTKDASSIATSTDASTDTSNATAPADASDGGEKNVPDQPKILVSFKMFCDPHMTGVPSFIVNFVFKYGIGILWYVMLKVATEIQSGQRPMHTAAIESKPELYEFIRNRATVMMDKAAAAAHP